MSRTACWIGMSIGSFIGYQFLGTSADSLKGMIFFGGSAFLTHWLINKICLTQGEKK